MSGFWRGRTVLVTGHTGFKGGWLCLWLRRLGARVAGFALPPPTRPSLFEDARVARGMRSVEGDIRRPAALRAALAGHRPEIVFHLAAQALVRRSYARPAETFETNVMGTARLLDAARRNPSVRAVVVVTSDKCYEPRRRKGGLRETDPMGGRDPYSASKGCAELVAAAYRRSFFEPDGARVATVRAGNVIGGGDWAEDRLVPDLVRAFLARTPARIRNPSAVRPWQHVLDPLRGYLMLAERLCGDDGPDWAEGWNFGPPDGEARPVRDVAGILCRELGPGADWAPDSGEHPPETRRLRLDAARARERLGWEPVLDLETALRWTAGWYRRWRAGRDMRPACERQIAEFESRAGRPA